MPAYFAPGVSCAQRPAKDIPEFARVASAGPWACCDSSQCGANGALIFLVGAEQPAVGHGKPEDWIDCGDGLRYLTGQPMPTQAELVRDHNVRGIDYLTSRGITLTVPVATASPRKISFASKKALGYATDFAELAFRVFDRISDEKGLSPLDPDVLKVVADAIGHVYRTTPEILDELGWITSADIDPIICCIFGSDPKASNPAGGSSPLPAGA